MIFYLIQQKNDYNCCDINCFQELMNINRFIIFIIVVVVLVLVPIVCKNHRIYKFQSNTTFNSVIIATCFDSYESSSGYLLNYV